MIVAGVLWGLNGVFSRIAIDGGIEPLELGSWRAIAAALILLPFVLLNVRRIERSMLVPIALFGVIGIVASQGLFFESISRIDVALALVIVYTAPIPVAASPILTCASAAVYWALITSFWLRNASIFAWRACWPATNCPRPPPTA